MRFGGPTVIFGARIGSAPNVLWMALAIFLLSATANAAEQRCRDMAGFRDKFPGSGEQCFCSETANEPFPRFGGGKWPIGNPFGFFDFPGSPDSSECPGEKGNGQAFTSTRMNSEGVDPGSIGKALAGVPWVALSRGEGCCNFVLAGSASGANPEPGGATIDTTHKTVCIRHYLATAPGVPVPKDSSAATQRFKVMTLDMGNVDAGGFDKTIQFAWGGANSSLAISYDSPIWGGNACRRVETGWQLNTNHWYRVELCADHVPSGPNQNRLNYRARVDRINQDGRLDATFAAPECLSDNRFPQAWLWPGSHIAGGLVTNQGFGENDPVRMWSHAMIATNGYNPEWWIGPAAEVESGGTPPVPPPAPILLDP